MELVNESIIEFSSIDSNIVTQWIDKSGPKINPGFNKDLKLNPFLAIKRLRNILPKKVLYKYGPTLPPLRKEKKV